jgi:hypothetical protein
MKYPQLLNELPMIEEDVEITDNEFYDNSNSK